MSPCISNSDFPHLPEIALGVYLGFRPITRFPFAVAHELGHMAAAKVLFKRPPTKVYVTTGSEEKVQIWPFSNNLTTHERITFLGKYAIKGGTAGVSYCISKKTPFVHAKIVAIAASGPITQIAIAHMVRHHYMKSAFQNEDTLSIVTCTALTTQLTYFIDYAQSGCSRDYQIVKKLSKRGHDYAVISRFLIDRLRLSPYTATSSLLHTANLAVLAPICWSAHSIVKKQRSCQLDK